MIDPKKITLVNASAGTGKTERLSRAVADALGDGGIDPGGLVAITYLKKAGAELRSRIRQTLLARGKFEQAARLPEASIGTVHSFCNSLVSEFALDRGSSPKPRILREGEADSALEKALEESLADSPELVVRLDERGRRLGIGASRDVRWDWMPSLNRIVSIARQNAIDPERLGAMAEASIETLLSLTYFGGDAIEDPEILPRLLEAVTKAREDLVARKSTRRNTGVAIEALERAASRIQSMTGEDRVDVPWVLWLTLASVQPEVALTDLVAPVREIASRHPRLRDMRQDIAEFTRDIFAAAAKTLRGYKTWKDDRRYVDYQDMESLALGVLEDEALGAMLPKRIRFVVVDEFQDTSPIQLALFTRLAEIAERSLWVGDPKQSIMGFQQSDPGLTEAVARSLAEGGAIPENLSTNYRSRPGLADAVSRVFSRVFEQQGMTREQVSMSAQRTDPPEFEAIPPVAVWLVSTGGRGNAEEDILGIVQGIERMLATPGETPVVDRASGAVRPVRPGDIAVLMRTNVEMKTLAERLGVHGIQASTARRGLLSTPEATMLKAGLRLVLDANDTLAVAEISALQGFGGMDPDEWLARRLEEAAGPEGEADAEAVSADPVASVRVKAMHLAPSEAVDATILALDLVRLATRWPEWRQRLNNLEQLRAMATAYEERCVDRGEAATIAGLLSFFDRAAGERSDGQHVEASGDAVHLSTYHRAKGLEWPVVVLGSSQRKLKWEPTGGHVDFELDPGSSGAESRPRLDPANPLTGRWVRYWAWPYGRSGAALRNEMTVTPFGTRLEREAIGEDMRLMYVGWTRARDHLVLTGRVTMTFEVKAPWLDRITDGRGALLSLPVPTRTDPREAWFGAEIRVRGDESAIPARVMILPGDEKKDPLGIATDGAGAERSWFAVPSGAPGSDSVDPSEGVEAPGYRIVPSAAGMEETGFDADLEFVVERLGARAPFLLGEHDPATVGEAVHAFFAVDDTDLPDERRIELASGLLQRHGVGDVVPATSLVAASSALFAYIARRWPGATVTREVPIRAIVDSEMGTRRIEGTIDMLVRHSDGSMVVIDHKSYPGGARDWAVRAREHAGQLRTYARALEMAGERVAEVVLHFWVGGGVARSVDA